MFITGQNTPKIITNVKFFCRSENARFYVIVNNIYVIYTVKKSFTRYNNTPLIPKV